MKVDSFDFELPQHLIAQTPLPERTASRLLALNKKDGSIAHHTFTDLATYLQSGDVLVLNDTRVLPARLIGSKPDTGARVELLLLKQLADNRWETLAKPAKRLKPGTELHFGTNAAGTPMLRAIVEETGEMGVRTVRFEYEGIFQEVLDALGEMPLPPYITEKLADKARYQTVYARQSGSAAAPTAGLHFTEQFLQQLRDKGIELAFLTLHVGLGTFRPVAADTVEGHVMHEEYYELDEPNAEKLNAAKQAGRRIVAVGTTSARTLESLAARFVDAPLQACNGWTGIFIYPGYQFRLVDALLTNFHLPRSTLVMLVSALAGREAILHAYEEAIKQEYRFFSFGDAMLIY